MAGDQPLNSTLSLKVGGGSAAKNPPDGDNPGVSSMERAEERIAKIEKELFTILKIVTIIVLSDDETCEDFMSTYRNYKTLGNVISGYGLNETSDFPYDEKEFSSNPIKCWIEILMISIIALHAFPNIKTIRCDTIGLNDIDKNENDVTCSNAGICYSTLLTLEALDWRQHSISIFIPFGEKSEGKRVLFMVDGEIKLFA